MKVTAGLFQQHEQRLSMTQELSQAIMLLQYPAIELASFIEEKALENPLIEIEYDNLPAKRGKTADPADWIRQISDVTITLHTYLMSQIPFNALTDSEEAVLRYLINNVDDNGYLRITYDEAAGSMSVSREVWDVAVEVLQTFEPAGVGAYNLKECLLLQVNRCDLENELARKILENHFELFAERKWRDLGRVMSVSIPEIQKVSDYIQQFDPRPGASYQTEKSQFAIPDVRIFWVNGELVVKVPDTPGFSFGLNHDYYSLIQQKENSEAQMYLKEKYLEYKWLQRAVGQRNETLARIMNEMVKRQEKYFKSGKKEYLKPMTLKEVADSLGIHESTVSRAVRDKILQTPTEVTELKKFFSAAIQTDRMEDASAERVRLEIGRLVAEEEKTSPLSDQAIADFLQQKQGIIISRRTIAKYREQLKIPSSSKRRRYK